MANNSRTTRRIEVDGRTYFGEASSEQNSYMITVRSADGPGQVLRLTRIPLLTQDMRGLNAAEDVQEMVPELIRAALRRNWRPDDPGLPDFIL